MRTYYEVLGVSATASQDTIRTTYHALLKIYHPDINGDPDASVQTKKLNLVYEVLGDPAKRTAYDSWLKTSQGPKHGPESRHPTTEVHETPASPPPELKCIRCGIQDSTLRASAVYWVFSVILITKRGQKNGIWCERCRAIEVLKHTAVAGTVGWWGFPWGPIYTICALFNNGKGGKQDANINGDLLSIVGYQLLQKGQMAEALLALQKSLRFKPDNDTLALRDQLTAYTGIAAQKPKIAWRFVPAMASAGVVFILAVAVFAVIGDSKGPTTSSPTYIAAAAPVSPSVSAAQDDSVSTPPHQDVSLPTGFPMKTKRRASGRGTLSVENGTSQDAVINIVAADTRKVIRRFYVKAGDTYKELRFSPGRYDIVYVLGNDWNPTAKAFNRTSERGKFDEQLNFSEEEEGNRVNFHEFSITLQPVLGGNVRTTSVDEADLQALMADND